jgi:KDO2-lipid IV(A) lauroyltransferase
MYQLVYGFFYILSLLPWRLVYIISDFIAFILEYVVKYRKVVIEKNLAIAFPKNLLKNVKKLRISFTATLPIRF